MLHCNLMQFYLETYQVIVFLNVLEIEYEWKRQHCSYWKMLFNLLCDPTPNSPLHVKTGLH
jgi:hypothetical protein